ncbi:hypothetical protein LCGC14_1286410 [marine sediment metagenome]|uniref:Uncharacterized protein n=1 Tax=marine sediment metagenome TaxID=412755 RepID=A0A0F9KTR1_9ZZZZ
MEDDTKIRVGDFVFCLGEGMAIFPVESADETGAYLGPSVDECCDSGTGGNESLHKLTLVGNSEWAKDFPQFCRCPAFFLAGGDMVCETCGKLYYNHPQHNIFPWLNVICGGMVVKL